MIHALYAWTSEMTVEMANGTDLGHCVLVFELKEKFGKVPHGHIDNLTVNGSPPDLFAVQNHVRQRIHLRRDPYGFYLTGDLHLSDGRLKPIPLVCHQLWELFLRRVRRAGRIVLGVWHRQTDFTDCGHSASVPLSLFDVVPPFFGRPRELLSQQKVSEIATLIVAGVIELPMQLRPQLWKNLLGVFPPGMTSRERRTNYFACLVSCAIGLKERWLAKYRSQDPQTLQLYSAIQRDAERTDPGEDFFVSQGGVSPTGLDNVSCLSNVVMTYCEEHREVAYTQGMTDLVAPILYVLRTAAAEQAEVEAQVYVMFSAMMEGLKGNFSRSCRGAMEQVECVRHLCEVMDPALYGRLSSFRDDAFQLCFGMVLIDARREFSFQDGVRLLEVVWSSRSGGRTGAVAAAEEVEDWACFMTTRSRDILLSYLRREVPPGSEQSSSLNHEVPPPLPQKCYSERPAVGYAVTPLPSDDNAEVAPSLLDSGRVTPFRPFDTEGDVRSQSSSAAHSLNVSLDNPELTASAQSGLLTGPTDVQATVGSSYTVFIVAAIFIVLRKRIMSQGNDFVSFSLTLRNSQSLLSLKQVLFVARQLKEQYTFYQCKLFGQQVPRWLHQFTPDQ